MKKLSLILFTLFISLALSAGDFVNRFIEKYGANDRTLNNVNIGKTMLDRMAANTSDEELKNAFKDLNSIRIVSSDDAEDSQHFFDNAHELVKDEFSDYEEVVSVNENMSKISVFMERGNSDNQNLILISLDDSGLFSLIT